MNPEGSISHWISIFMQSDYTGLTFQLELHTILCVTRIIRVAAGCSRDPSNPNSRNDRKRNRHRAHPFGSDNTRNSCDSRKLTDQWESRVSRNADLIAVSGGGGAPRRSPAGAGVPTPIGALAAELFFCDCTIVRLLFGSPAP